MVVILDELCNMEQIGSLKGAESSSKFQFSTDRALVSLGYYDFTFV